MSQEEVQGQTQQPQEQPEQQQQEQAEQEQPEQTLSKREQSFRNLRQAKEQAEREREEYSRRLQELEQKVNQQSQSQQDKSEDDPQLAPDDLVEWKHVKKNFDKLNNKLKEYEQKSQMTAAETRLRNDYPDIDSVVTQENLQKLAKEYPEIAQSLNSNQDIYSKGSGAYKLIKQFGIGRSEEYDQQKQQTHENLEKPRPTSSVQPQKGSTPLENANAFANGLTPDLKKQLWKEMKEASKKS